MTYPVTINDSWAALVAQHPTCPQLEAARVVGSGVFGWERSACSLQTDGTSWAQLLRQAQRNAAAQIDWSSGSIPLSIDETRRRQNSWMQRWLVVEAIVCGMSPEFVRGLVEAMMRSRGVDPAVEIEQMGQAIVDAHLCAAEVRS